MALISEAKVKHTSGAYNRILGDLDAALLNSQVQSTAIRNGYELEEILEQKASHKITNIDEFIKQPQPNGTYLCSKKALKNSSYGISNHETDFAIITVKNNNKEWLNIELKDGSDFDTKKSQKEYEHLKEYTNFLKGKNINSTFAICCFNSETKEEIVKGLKHAFSDDSVLTGKDLCNMLNLNYQQITAERAEHTYENLKYVVEGYLEIGKKRGIIDEGALCDFLIDNLQDYKNVRQSGERYNTYEAWKKLHPDDGTTFYKSFDNFYSVYYEQMNKNMFTNIAVNNVLKTTGKCSQQELKKQISAEYNKLTGQELDERTAQNEVDKIIEKQSSLIFYDEKKENLKNTQKNVIKRLNHNRNSHKSTTNLQLQKFIREEYKNISGENLDDTEVKAMAKDIKQHNSILFHELGR